MRSALLVSIPLEAAVSHALLSLPSPAVYPQSPFSSALEFLMQIRNLIEWPPVVTLAQVLSSVGPLSPALGLCDAQKILVLSLSCNKNLKEMPTNSAASLLVAGALDTSGATGASAQMLMTYQFRLPTLGLQVSTARMRLHRECGVPAEKVQDTPDRIRAFYGLDMSFLEGFRSHVSGPHGA